MNSKTSKEMMVRKSTNGETWVQHVLEGLTSGWAGLVALDTRVSEEAPPTPATCCNSPIGLKKTQVIMLRVGL